MADKLYRICNLCMFARNLVTGLDNDAFCYCTEQDKWLNGGLLGKECPLFMINPKLTEGVIVDVHQSNAHSSLLSPDLLSRINNKAIL